VSGVDQLRYLSWLLYLVIFGLVLVRTLRRPTPAHFDMTLFFGAVAMLIILNSLVTPLLAQPAWLTSDITGAIAMALGYLLLRLVRDFSDVSRLTMATVEVGLAASILAIVILPSPLPPAPALVLVAYVVLVLAFDTWAFARHATQTRGVTRRRMQAAAAGSLCLVLVLLMSGLGVALPAWTRELSEVIAALGLASGVCYFLGFAPPTWLRRAWQEPEVRAFLARAASLPRLPTTRDIVHELELGAASALGAPAANIALWDPDSRRLQVYYRPPPAIDADAAIPPAQDSPFAIVRDGIWEVDPSVRPVPGRAFLEQRATLITDTLATDPDNAALYELYKARAVVSAPITAGDNRLGVLIVYAPRAPVFANSDLELVQVMADQAAVILESRALIDDVANFRAREEAARLKEDFLSSAAHDLKTPLTGLVTQAQLLLRRSERDPDAPADRPGLNRLLEQSLRLKDLVLELLDVSLLDEGNLLGDLEDIDVLGLLDRLRRRESSTWTRVALDGQAPVVARVDPTRFEQVVTHLIENALKYSPAQTPVVVSVWTQDGEARLSVRDFGIGIPAQDQPLVFERFHRARNVDDRRFAGMGLGLYIARGIVEQHGGRIWLQSTPGQGSTFFVALPTVTTTPVDNFRLSRLASA
jgi:signal transduction histidine kinase